MPSTLNIFSNIIDLVPPPATLGTGAYRYLTLNDIDWLRITSRPVQQEINQHGGEVYVQNLLSTDVAQLSPVILNELILMGQPIQLPNGAFLNRISDAAFQRYMAQQTHLRASDVIGLDNHHISLLTEQQLFRAFTNTRTASHVLPNQELTIQDVLVAILPSNAGQPVNTASPEERQLILSVAQVFHTFYAEHPPTNDHYRSFIHQIDTTYPRLLSNEVACDGYEEIYVASRYQVLHQEIAGDLRTSAYLFVNKFIQTQLETTRDHDWFGMLLSKGSTYTFRMNNLGGNLDSYLTLRDTQGMRITSDGDSDGSLNSRIVFTAERDGVYYLDASSYASLSSGSYEISSSVVDITALAVNSQYSTALTSVKKNQLFKIDLKAGKKYEFLMNKESTDNYFDAYLYLRDAKKNVIKHDDDSGGSYNSKISYTAQRDGEYYLDASSWQQLSEGKFTVVSHQVI